LMFEDFNYDNFFTEEIDQKEKKVKTVVCPKCGEEIEI